MSAINGETKLIGFFGSTYRTSKMYAMYNAAIAALGLNYVYVPFAVNDLATAVAGIRHLGIAAVGVTIPYKTAIIPYLDELDEPAERVGAVAVVVNRDGRLIGSNTDGAGALTALEEATAVAGKRVTILGAGGAARAIAFTLSDLGCQLTIFNRTHQKAVDLAQSVGKNAMAKEMGKVTAVVSHADILINTTSFGMVNTGTEGQSLIPVDALHPDLVVMDIITKPKQTKLLNDAQAIGCQIVYGERMLLWQGVYKFEIYTGVQPPPEVMEAAMNRLANG